MQPKQPIKVWRYASHASKQGCTIKTNRKRLIASSVHLFDLVCRAKPSVSSSSSGKETAKGVVGVFIGIICMDGNQ